MPLSEAAAVEQTKQMLRFRDAEKDRLDLIRGYLRDDPSTRGLGRRLQGLPAGLPAEVHDLARVARVNMLKFVVNSRVQNMFVDGFRTPRSATDVRAWEAWQRNRFDARQIGVHRAAVSYGAAFVTGMPGRGDIPVLRGASPRNMTAVYGDDPETGLPDDDWPRFALERLGGTRYRLFDDEALYWMRVDPQGGDVEFIDSQKHGVRFDGEPVTPVIRYRETDDLDDPVIGIVEPLISLQNQINITTFGLLVAQHYGAFKQRYIIGWLAQTEEERLRASASKLMTFEDHPDEVKVGEFSQTDLGGYIDSREATLRHLATVSQTPAHELLGQLVNLSAEALAAAEASNRRAITENQTALGESHEQTLNLASELMGEEIEPSAAVRWRDTEARALGMVVDALGKLAQMLGVPPQELWEEVPGVTDDQVERWKAAAVEGDALGQLNAIIDRQMGGQSENGREPVAVGG